MLATVSGVFRLSRDVELKYLPSGSALAKVGLVNSKKFKSQSGEQKEKIAFIDGTLFNKPAEVFNQYLQKGSKVFIIAELEQEQWVAQDGTNRSKHSLNIKEFEFLDSKNDNAPQTGGHNTPNPQMQNNQQYQQNLNDGNQMMDNRNGQQNITEIDIDTEEIPF